MATDQLEEPPNEALRRPVRDANAATGAQHAHDLVGRALMIRRKHRAERRQHYIEAAVRKRQFLDVGLLESDDEALGARALTALVEQRRHIVGRGDAGEAARSGERRVAVAGCDVEHSFVGTHVDGFGQ